MKRAPKGRKVPADGKSASPAPRRNAYEKGTPRQERESARLWLSKESSEPPKEETKIVFSIIRQEAILRKLSAGIGMYAAEGMAGEISAASSYAMLTVCRFPFSVNREPCVKNFSLT